jgi:serine/threonine-protein kinase RsbW
MPETGPSVRERLPVVPTSIREARALAGGWSLDQGASADQVLNIQLAISELVANVVRHAHPSGGANEFVLEARREGAHLGFCVRDFGVGPQGPSADPGLGVGLTIVARVAESASVEHADPGTRVTMRFPPTA